MFSEFTLGDRRAHRQQALALWVAATRTVTVQITTNLLRYGGHLQGGPGCVSARYRGVMALVDRDGCFSSIHACGNQLSRL